MKSRIPNSALFPCFQNSKTLAFRFRFFPHFFLLIALYLTSCQDDIESLRPISTASFDGVEKDFFDLHNDRLFNNINSKSNIQARSSDIRLLDIYDRLIELNDSLNFVPDFIQQYGYPYWNGAIGLNGDTDESYVIGIPTLFTDGTEVSGIFLCSKINQELLIEFRSGLHLRNYIDSISNKPLWVNAKIYAGLIMTAEIGLFDSTRLNYFNFIVEETETSSQSAIQPRSDYQLVKICFLVPAGSNPTGSYPNWIVQLGYQYIPTSEWKPLAAWESLIGTTITEEQYNELVDFYADHGVGGSPNSYSGPQYQIVCHYYWVPVGGDPYDYIFSGNGLPGNSVPPGSGTGSPNAPVVDLDTYLRRIEACGGLGDQYDYGPSNPTGEHPDRVFCEQLQDLYDCLPFLASDSSLIAWYLWYDANFPGDTWESLYQFGCSSHMSPIQKEEGIRLFKKHCSPGSAYPPFNNDWGVFLMIWKDIWTSSLPARHKGEISKWLDENAINVWSTVSEVVNDIEYLYQVNVDIKPNEVPCLLGQSGSASQLSNYINAAITFDPSLSSYMADFGGASIDLLCADPLVKMARMIDLDVLLRENPNALIQECLEQNPGINIQDYFHLFNFEIPQSCKDRLEELGNGWSWQPIEQGNVKKASLDYYPVEIILRPDFNDDGNPDSNEEIFHAIRMEFLELASGGVNNFNPDCIFAPISNISWEFMFYDQIDPNYSGLDYTLWPSQSPIESIFYIHAESTSNLTDFFSDNGAVIVSDYCPNQCWTFSTITSPASESQPLSGNRQWGITEVNGILTLYNRAADRAHVTGFAQFFTGNSACSANDYYRIGVETWKNLQNHIQQFIYEHGGGAVIDPNKRIAINPDFNELYSKLKSDDSIQSVPCISHE